MSISLFIAVGTAGVNARSFAQPTRVDAKIVP